MTTTQTDKTSFSPSDYFYDDQIRKYLIQVMHIFSEMYVKTGKREDGKEKFISVPVTYGSRDRVTSHIMSSHTQNKPIKLPAISVYKSGLSYNPGRTKGVGTMDRQTYLPQGGEFPNDISTLERRMPVPYDMTVEVSIIASNTHQQLQLLEQIMMLFDPMLEIQKTDNLEDWESITQVELQQIFLEENYPPGPDRRLIVVPMQFVVPIWISTPKSVKKGFAEKLRMKLATIPSDYDIDTPINDYENDSNVDIRDIDIT